MSLKKFNVDFEVFLIKGKGTLGYLRNYFPLRKKINSSHYDLLHAHYGLSGMLAVLQRKLPVVVTYHGSDIHNKKENYISSCAAFFTQWSIFVTKALYENIRYKPKNFSIIPCGVDFNLFKPVEKLHARRELGLKEGGKYILFSSAFGFAVKNYALAKKALESINKVTLLELTGYTRGQVSLLLNACDLLLMTSLREGSPQLIKEAMACNCPIVSTDVGDVKKNIDGTEGCFISSLEPEDVAEKIQKALRFAQRTNGREKIKHFETSTLAEKVFEVYTNVTTAKTK